jgi:hypothetical protein
VAGPDVPEKDRLAEAVVWCLCEGAGASDGAAAIVKPITCDVPVRYFSHEDLHAADTDYVEKVPASFDHLVRRGKQRLRDIEAKCFRCLEIDD